MTLDNLYVKFSKYDNHVIENLVNKTCWFSTVYNFNDIAEQCLVIFSDKLEKDSNIYKEIKSFLNHDHNATCLVNAISGNPYFENKEVKAWTNEIISCIRHNRTCSLDPEQFNCVLQHAIYLKTGIFCLSKLKVFDDDAAQIMFAHYAENLKGVALIFQSDGVISNAEVLYEDQTDITSDSDDYLSLLKGTGRDKYFNKKSICWSNEKEHRFFNEPGICQLMDCGLKLTGIFYTERFTGDHKLLNKINESFYDSELFINKLFLRYNNTQRIFKVFSEGKFIDPSKFITNVPTKPKLSKGNSSKKVSLPYIEKLCHL